MMPKYGPVPSRHLSSIHSLPHFDTRSETLSQQAVISLSVSSETAENWLDVIPKTSTSSKNASGSPLRSSWGLGADTAFLLERHGHPGVRARVVQSRRRKVSARARQIWKQSQNTPSPVIGQPGRSPIRPSPNYYLPRVTVLEVTMLTRMERTQRNHALN